MAGRKSAKSGGDREPEAKDCHPRTVELVTVPVDQIKVGVVHLRGRPRDVEELARKIGAEGLLEPLVATPRHELVAGYRRLLARGRLDLVPHPLLPSDIARLALSVLDHEAAGQPSGVDTMGTTRQVNGGDHKPKGQPEAATRLPTPRQVLRKAWGFGVDDPRYTRWLTGLTQTPEQFLALKRSVADGSYTGRIVFAHDGSILDGHYAYLAHTELNRKPRRGEVTVFDVSSWAEEEVWERIRRWELARKHLTPRQRRKLVADELRQHNGNLSDREVARRIHADKETVAHVRGELEELSEIERFRFAGGRGKKTGLQVKLNGIGELPAVQKNLAEIHGQGLEGVLCPRLLRKKAASVRAARRDREASELACPERARIEKCDFRELLVEPHSVDVIWTDMPWPKEFRHLLDDLARRARVWLKPMGLLCLYPGHDNKDEANDLLRRSFVKVAELAVFCPDGFEHKGRTTHKHSPILVFSNGEVPDRDWRRLYTWGAYDALTTRRGEKELHSWQRTVQETKFFLQSLSRPGYLVCDPFGGSFTTAEAAIRLGCRFVGCDSDATPGTSGLSNAEVGRRRVARVCQELKEAGTGGSSVDDATLAGAQEARTRDQDPPGSHGLYHPGDPARGVPPGAIGCMP